MTQVVSQGFQGSDTDELDKIVSKMREAAQYAENIARALQILCKALDAMSWTGYAAALAAYLRGVVIPLLKTVAAELKAFAAIVSMASSVQKDASSDKWIVDTGDVGYTPQQLPSGADDVQPAGRQEVSVADAPTIGGVDAATAPTRQQVSATSTGTTGPVDQVGKDARLTKVAQDIATLMGHIQQLSGATSDAGSTAQAIEALGSVVTDIGRLLGDTDGGDALATGATDGSTVDGVSDPTGASTVTGATGTASGIDFGTDEGLQQIWNSVNGVLRDLGLLPPDAPDPGSLAGATDPSGATGIAGIAAGTADVAGTVTVDRGVVSGDLDAISEDLDQLRSDLGLDSSSGSPDFPTVQYGTGSDDYLTTPTTSDVAAMPMGSGAAGDGTYYSDGVSTGLGTSGGSTGGDAPSAGSGGGSTGGGSGGGSIGSAAPSDAGAADAAQPAHAADTQPTYATDARVPVTASGAVPSTVVTDGPQTRLVATTVGTGTSSAAIPLSGGAVAASLLGGMFARKARQAAASGEAGVDDTSLNGAGGTGSATDDLAGPIYQP